MTTPLKCHSSTTSWLLSGCLAGPFEHRVRDFISLVLIFSAWREASGSRKWSTNIYFLKILFKVPRRVSEVWQLPCKELFWNSPSLKPKTCSYFSNFFTFSTFTVWLIWFLLYTSVDLGIKRPSPWFFSSLRMVQQRWERWLNSWKCWLFFWKSWVDSWHPPGDSQLLVTPVPENLMSLLAFLDTLYKWCIGIHADKALMHIKRKRMSH